MHESNAYTANRYLYPDGDLPFKSDEELHSLISRRLPVATDLLDGLSGNRPEQIDHAQDIVEQARDLLLDRGATFSDEERLAMFFLEWPLTEAEAFAREEKERAEHQEQQLTSEQCLVRPEWNTEHFPWFR